MSTLAAWLTDARFTLLCAALCALGLIFGGLPA